MNRKFLSDLFSVVTSNSIALIGSIVTGFIVPMLLGVEEYGIYKLFTLYISYAVLLHFGFVDGILLNYAGTDYKQLNKEKFRAFSKFFILFQLLIAGIIVVSSIVFIPADVNTIFILLGIDTIAINLTAYYQYISQSTLRFKELSIRKIVLSISKIVLAVILLCCKFVGIVNVANAYYYVFGLVFIDLGLTIWYIYTYRDITFGISEHFYECKNEIFQLFKTGIFLTIAYEVAHLIFALDRQFVSVLFDTKTYSIYSFAYNLISMVTTIVSAVSVVLFPMLKRQDKDTIMVTFTKSMAAIEMVAFGSLIGYQPLSFIVCFFLPEYIDSLKYLYIIFPGLALSCCISIVMFTYYKAIDRHVEYFKVSCIVLGITILLNAIAYNIFHDPMFISIASIITLLIWYSLCQRYFIKKYRIQWKKNTTYIFIMTFCFYSINGIIQNIIVAFVSYAAAFILTTICFYRELIGKKTLRLHG